MHVVRSDGRVTAGFDAVLTLAGWLPLLWPLAVFGRLPGVLQAGRRVYMLIANSRRREPCSDDVCGLHPPGRRDRPTAAEARR
jgi:hypothetical protein